MSNSQSSSDKFIALVVMVAALYFGGWGIVFGGDNYLGWAPYNADSISFERGVRIKINSGYYGMTYRSRFFDSPVLSWAAMALAVTLCGALFEDSDSDGETKSDDKQ